MFFYSIIFLHKRQKFSLVNTNQQALS